MAQGLSKRNATAQIFKSEVQHLNQNPMFKKIKSYFKRKSWRQSIAVGDVVLVLRNSSESKQMKVVTLPNSVDERIGVYTVSTGYELYPLSKVYQLHKDKPV